MRRQTVNEHQEQLRNVTDRLTGQMALLWRAVEERLLGDLLQAEEDEDAYIIFLAKARSYINGLMGQYADRIVQDQPHAVDLGRRLASRASARAIPRMETVDTLPPAWSDSLYHSVDVAIRSVATMIEEQEYTDYQEDSLRALGAGRAHAQMVGRDFLVDSFRQASSLDGEKYQRVSALAPTTCMACVVLDGVIYDSPLEFADHPNGFCMIMPVDYVELEYSGEDWFAELDEGEKEQLMGRDYYKRWAKGLFRLEELVTYKNNYPVVTPLRGLT